MYNCINQVIKTCYTVTKHIEYLPNFEYLHLTVVIHNVLFGKILIDSLLYVIKTRSQVYKWSTPLHCVVVMAKFTSS